MPQKSGGHAHHIPAKGTVPEQGEFSRLVALYETGQYAELESRARLLVERHPDFGLGWKLLSASLLMQGKDALRALQMATKFLPGEAELHNNLGDALVKLGRYSEGEVSFRRALQIKPKYADAHYNLGYVLEEQNRHAEAEASLMRALEIQPDFVDAQINLCSIMMVKGRHAEAEISMRRILENYPDSAEAYSTLGSILIEQGRFAEAEASLMQALEIQPDFVKAKFSMAQVRKAKAGDENLAALIAIEEESRSGALPLPDKKAIFLHYALGKSYDDIGEYEKAFPHFFEGGRLKRATVDYDPEKNARYFASIMRNFDMAAIDRLRGGGDPSRLPIFILGMPRSGTTLTEQIIASHPDVYGAGELHDLMAIAQRNIAAAPFPDNVSLLDTARLAAWGAEYVARLQRRAPEARHITDKMPANFHAVGLIHLMLPNARIVHVNRNPVDTCLSCFSKLFTTGQNYSYDLTELGRYYADYARLMEHWRNVLPDGAFFDVRYEDIVADQEAQARRIIEYCGLEWHDACLDFYKNKRAISTASVLQVRQPIYQSSVERWRNYEKFLGPLFDALGELAPAIQEID